MALVPRTPEFLQLGRNFHIINQSFITHIIILKTYNIAYFEVTILIDRKQCPVQNQQCIQPDKIFKSDNKSVTVSFSECPRAAEILSASNTRQDTPYFRFRSTSNIQLYLSNIIKSNIVASVSDLNSPFSVSHQVIPKYIVILCIPVISQYCTFM